MKILIIGSKGFIGSHLFNYYSSNTKHQLFGSDIVVDYGTENYFLIDPSLPTFESIFQEQSFDVCINCVGAASVPDSVKDPHRDYYLNTKFVFDLLDSIRKFSPTIKFINLSSAAVYGNPIQLPVKEEDRISPLSPYGWHKYQSELICQEFSAVYGLTTCALRVFSAYGIGLKKQLFWDWYHKAKTSAPFLIFGTGTESRDFIYIDDLVQAIDCIANADLSGFSVYNIANGEELLIRDAIQIFENWYGENLKYKFSMEIRLGDPKNWVADISKLTALGYKQSVQFKEGVHKYLQWLHEKV